MNDVTLFFFSSYKIMDCLMVAAIDFGTSYSGYAFSTRYEFEKDPVKVSTTEWRSGSGGHVSWKTPTAVLLDQREEFLAFGFDAQNQYNELCEDEEGDQYYYFEQFKMILYDPKVILFYKIIFNSSNRVHVIMITQCY